MASKNPVEGYLAEKTASATPFWRDVAGKSIPGANTFVRGIKDGLTGAATAAAPGAAAFGERLGRGVVGTGTAVASAGALALGVHGANKLYDVATKARDFRQMLNADPELAQLHAEHPQRVNQMFSTLRTFNPQFTRDPIVASHYVKQMASDPMHAGSMATEALNFRDKMNNPLADQVTRAAFGHRK